MEVTTDTVFIPKVINAADDPNAMSVTSVGPLVEGDDILPVDKEEVVIAESVSGEQGDEGDKKVVVKPPVTEPSPVIPPDETKPIEEEAKPREKDAVQRRIDELTKKRREAERERDFERQKREELEATLETTKKAVPLPGKPQIVDYETELEYLEALTDWKIEQKLVISKEKDAKTSQEMLERRAVEEAYNILDDRLDKGREKYADFDTLVLSESLSISDAMVNTLLYSNIAEDVLYYLGQHPDEAAIIFDMPAIQVARELGKIEAKLEKAVVVPVQQVTPPVPVSKKITNAPAPITPIRTTGVVEKRPEDMSFKEYRAWREKGK